MSSILDTISKLGTGQTLKTSAPLHAASIHVPFVFLAFSFLLNSLLIIPGSARLLDAVKLVPATISMKEVAKFSKVCTILGVLGAVPAISTGLCELYQLWINGSKDKSVPKGIRSGKLAATLKHAGMMDAVVGIGAWNWWAISGAKSPMVPRINALASALALPIIVFSAHMGGKLAYAYGVGVQRQGLGAQIKQAQTAKAN